MRKNFGKQTYFYPLPVLIIGSYDKDNKPNAMNAAWGGIYDTNQVIICLSTDHKTTDNIKLKNEFTVSFADSMHVVEADYVGIASGNDEDKIKKANLHVIKSEFVDAPYFEEFLMTLECRVNKITEDDGTTWVVGDIINVNADESVLTDGKIDLSKLRIISYDPVHHTYVELGNKVGHAFKDGLKLK
ncbi:MAG: flavin reductase family protein [Erysipelotrichales bacterium]|nr:flavin reductase family protein [Erysipelotrichales bacterium]